ncbi:uncharacterized protein EI97DRAFT_31852 [Westerdykella ornata]|uniref:Alpha/beta-hydrolase n=1 Tax=Westerdykella ornata TaxID=318751 RepID=A0A6A6K2B2_WESOR|nr:uncharacterized protein EI97DRAFT_31852 [Westerdykella ornata]KAF2281529.1 hypothetical protein EI97DRAFT_31852 [Westerdykella ornata]
MCRVIVCTRALTGLFTERDKHSPNPLENLKSYRSFIFSLVSLFALRPLSAGCLSRWHQSSLHRISTYAILLEPAMTWRLLLIGALAAQAFSSPLSKHKGEGGISWAACDPNKGLPPNVQCAHMTVPVNWDNPHGDTFQLSLLKVPRPSNSTVKRIGYLFINPGGPGGSAIGALAQVAAGAAYMPPEILSRFDLIAVEPRGVGDSAGSKCDHNIWNERVSLFPKTEEEFHRLVDKNRRLGESCLKLTGPVVKYVDTISAVKDHEAVRKALGEKMNFLGLSYGSQIGAQYAQLFPDNIRAMVFDGVVQHSQSASSNILIEGTAHDAALRSFFTWASTNDTSPLKGQNVEQLWQNLLKTAADTPIPAPRCNEDTNSNGTICRKTVTDDDIRRFPQEYLNAELVPIIAKALADASKGDASDISPSLSSETAPANFAGITIGCLDWPSTASSFKEFQAKMRIGERFAPLTKGASQSYELQASCIGWPMPARNPPTKLKVRTRAPILLVNSVGDSSSSYTWAVGMLEEIENSVLLTRNGEGHTSFERNGATTQAIVDFLISTKLPAPGTLLDS